MENLDALYQILEDTQKAVAAGDKELAEKLGWELCNRFTEDYHVNESTYSPEMSRLQLECFATILDIHIMRGDPIDISFRYGQLMEKFKMDMEHFPEWNDEERLPIVKIAVRMTKRVEAFYSGETRVKHRPKATKPGEIKCLLCRKNPADKAGSHMVPHMLIAKTFSYDGSKDRDKVVVDVTNLAEGYRDRYFGHHVYDDTVTELIGRSMTDEEIEEENKKVNALTRDYVFCECCEKRFSTIEAYYSDILEGRLKKYPPEIPYLFWMSVMWRMSIGDMGCKLEKGHEEKLRKVLHNCLALKREDILTKRSKLGYCAYSLYRILDTRDETLGILGRHTSTLPYQALMGNMFINYYASSNRAHSFCRQHHLPEQDLNEGLDPEKIGELTFIEFWSIKRRILDDVWNHDRSVWNLGTQQHQTLSKYEKNDMDDFLKRMGMKPAENNKNEYSAWVTAENSNVITFPRSIRKILVWMKEHDNEIALNKMSEDLGYSEEELKVMLQYWVEQAAIIEDKEKREKATGRLFEELLLMDRDVFHD